MLATQFIRTIARTISSSWQSLVLADILYKLLAFILLTPLFVTLFRCLLTLSGNSVLSDVDIAMFFAGPFGWLCAIVLGAVWLGIIAFEQATLLAIMAANASGSRIDVLSALRFTAMHAPRILHVAGRLIGWSLLIIAPFLALAAGIYIWLLSDYDINYYLNETPTEFGVAVAAGAVIAATVVGILLHCYSGWFLVLPLVLFAGVPSANGLRESRELVSGSRQRILVWLVTWALAILTVNALLTVIIGFAGRLLIPSSVGSLAILAARVGLLVLVLAAGSLILNLFATIGLAGILFHGYREIDPTSGAALAAIPWSDRPTQVIQNFLSRRRLLAAGVVGVLVAATLGYWSLTSIRLQDDVQIMAHRGASKVAPENTMAAFRQAIEDGAEWIEIDVQETADGNVVVVHDSDFMKLSKNPVKIWDAKLEDLQNIDIGSWFDPQFSSERVPTLAQVLRLCKDKVGVNIELKYYGHDQQLEQRVVDIIESEGMVDQIMVMSLKPAGIAKTKALRPDWKCGLLLSVYIGDLAKVEADFLAVNASFATRSFVNRAHEADKEVFVWTVNDVASISQALNRRVDGILTDRPDLAQQVLKQRAEMTTAQRLLTETAIFLNQPSNNATP